GRVSVPMWPFNLSVRLPIVALVGRYLTNQLIGREAISKRIAPFPSWPCGPVGLCGISSRFQLLSPSLRQVPHALLTRSPLNTEKINPLRIPFDLHVLGAPPAFVLSQDQTLYKMIFITLKVLNLVHSARNRLRPVNYSFGIFKCSLHFIRFRYKYSILFNFQGPAFVGRLTGDLFSLSSSA